MCLVLLAHRARADLPFVAALNRDEFFARPTAPARFWEDHPPVLAGRDLKAGPQAMSTWGGIARDGRFAFLTNYRDPRARKPGAPSRGGIVARFLANPLSAERALARSRLSAS